MWYLNLRSSFWQYLLYKCHTIFLWFYDVLNPDFEISVLIQVWRNPRLKTWIKTNDWPWEPRIAEMAVYRLKESLKTTIFRYFSFYVLCTWFANLWSNDALIWSFRWRTTTLPSKNMNIPYSIRMYWRISWQPTIHVL